MKRLPRAHQTASSSSSSPSSSDSSASSSNDAFGGGAQAAKEVSSAEHSNPDAVDPAFKERVDNWESTINTSLGKMSTGSMSAESLVMLALTVEQLEGFYGQDLSDADKTYLNETVSHMAENLVSILGSDYATMLNLSDSMKDIM